jgi:hypothetical protein
MTACMGGWCRKREQCPHYATRVGTPSERLCVKGKDGVLDRAMVEVKPEPEEIQFPRIHPRATFPDWNAA